MKTKKVDDRICRTCGGIYHGECQPTAHALTANTQMEFNDGTKINPDYVRARLGVSQAKAEYIVRAVNAHEPMIAAIKNAIANMKAANPLYLTVATMHGEIEALTDGIAFLEEALAKALGEGR